LRKLEQLIARLTEQKETLAAQGIDVPALIAKCRKQYDDYVASCRAQERALEEHLQAQANLADSEYNLYKSVKKQVEDIAENQPDHPQLPQWRATLEQWSQHLPKTE
jgi:septal ring factor EnvC (AmiA/AmiB activator)